VDHDAAATDRPDRRSVAVAGHTGDLATAVAGLTHPDGRVRATALGALARCRSLDTARLVAACDDPDPVVRRRAATLAAERDDIDLQRLLGDPDPSVVETAVWALGEQSPAAPTPPAGRIAALAAIATGHADPLCREAAVAALASLGEPAGLDAVLTALDDRPAIRRRAVVALAAFDDPRAEAALGAALHDRDRQVRETAEELLAVDRDPGDDAGGIS
jgi:HEAT repeat protein